MTDVATGNSNRDIVYRCTQCGAAQLPREQITVKRAVFKEMGEKGKTIKSRTTDWLCQPCLEMDPAWLQEALSSSPGMADTRLASGKV